VCVCVCGRARAFGARGGAVGCAVLQAGRLRVQFPMVSLEFFIDIFLSAILWALGSTETVTEMSTRNNSGGKRGRCVWLTSLPTRAECHEFWQPESPGKSHGLSRPVQRLLHLLYSSLLLNIAAFYEARKQEVKPRSYKVIAYTTRT
jgi:hypothetical protein